VLGVQKELKVYFNDWNDKIKIITFTTIFILMVANLLQSQIVSYYPDTDSICIEGHCRPPEIILSKIEDSPNDTLKIKCWSTVWWPKGMDDDHYRNQDIFYVIDNSNNNNRYEVWIEEEDSLSQSKIIVPYGEHVSILFEYFKLKVLVFSDSILIDSLTQHFEASSELRNSITTNLKTLSDIRVLDNYPNPFNLQTTISYNLLFDSHVSLTILNSIGQQVETLVEDFQTAGTHRTVWNATNLSTNIYFVHLRVNNYSFIKKCTIIK
jgi:hypothetical protein